MRYTLIHKDYPPFIRIPIHPKQLLRAVTCNPKDIPDCIQYKEVEIELTRKPWGCICGYCKENDTLYYKEVSPDKIPKRIYLRPKLASPSEIANRLDKTLQMINKELSKDKPDLDLLRRVMCKTINDGICVSGFLQNRN